MTLADDVLLTFEDFTHIQEGMPRFDHFYLHFTDNKAYADVEEVIRFKEEPPDLYQSLYDGIMAIKGNKSVEKLRPFFNDLYEAYEIMFSYNPSNSLLLGSSEFS